MVATATGSPMIRRLLVAGGALDLGPSFFLDRNLVSRGPSASASRSRPGRRGAGSSRRALPGGESEGDAGPMALVGMAPLGRLERLPVTGRTAGRPAPRQRGARSRRPLPQLLIDLGAWPRRPASRTRGARRALLLARCGQRRRRRLARLSGFAARSCLDLLPQMMAAVRVAENADGGVPSCRIAADHVEVRNGRLPPPFGVEDDQLVAEFVRSASMSLRRIASATS